MTTIPLVNTPIKLPNYDQRAIFLGGTGSGKSNLAMLMADQSKYEKFVYIDCQHNLHPKAPTVTLSKLDRLQWDIAFRRDRHILFRPKADDQTPAFFNQVLRMLHLRGKPKNRKTGMFDRPFIIYIDEAYTLGYGADFPKWATKIATLDRQKGIGLWTASQRPFNIPIPLRSECSYYYIFYLSYQEDIIEISKCGRPVKELKGVIESDLKLDHSFILIDRKTGEYEHHAAVQEF